jgi:hypothetical protein
MPYGYGCYAVRVRIVDIVVRAFTLPASGEFG